MRNPARCLKETKRGAWSKQEDQKLASYVRAHGEGCWNSLPKPAGLCRCGKSCRLRWTNYLKPDIKRGNFAEDEEDLVIKLHALLGNRWSLIAGRLPGRTGNEVKNYWNSHLKRKLIAMGIDPNNHRIGDHRKIAKISETNAEPSSASKNHEIDRPRKQIVDLRGDDDQVSDNTSFLEISTPCVLPDLNLDPADISSPLISSTSPVCNVANWQQLEV